MSNSNLGIAVSGKSGCGNTTTSAELANRLGLRLVNYTFRSLAADEGLEFEQLRQLAESDHKWDKLVDLRQVHQANEHPSVLASRLAIWMWKEAKLKVYLDAPLEVRAGRVLERERHHFPDFEAALRHTADRDEKDHRRYQEIYGIDNDDWSFADLIIDVSSITPFEIVNKIVAHLGLGS